MAKIPRYKYIAAPFDIYAGILILLTSTFFGAVSAFMLRRTTGKFDVFKQILVGLLLTSNKSTKLPSKREPRLRYNYCLMILLGFVFTNFYSAFLSSFLVTGISAPIKKVICNQHAFEVLGSKFPNLHFKILDYERYEESLHFLNPYYAYCVSDNFYKRFMFFKRVLKNRIYRLASPWITDVTYATHFIFNKDSKYTSKLKNFIEIGHTAGLIQKWLQNTASVAEKYTNLEK